MLAVVEMLSVELPEVVIEAGLKLAVMPLGNPLAVNETLPLNPLSVPMLTVKLVLLPATIACEVGVDVIEKFGGGGACVTVIPTVALWLRGPLVAPISSK